MKKNLNAFKISLLAIMAFLCIAIPVAAQDDSDDDYDYSDDDFSYLDYLNYYYSPYAYTAPTAEDYYNSNKSKFVRPKSVTLSIIYFDLRNRDQKAKDAELKAATALAKKVKKSAEAFTAAVEAGKAAAAAGKVTDAGYIAEPVYIFAFTDEFKKAFGDDFYAEAEKLALNDISPLFETPSGYYLIKAVELHPEAQLGIDDQLSQGEKTTVRQYIQAWMDQNGK